MRWGRLSKKRKAALILGIGLLLLLVLLAMGDTAGGISAIADSFVTDNESRVSYLNSLGWQVDPLPISRQKVTIPRKFSDVYEQYNELQRQQGFDLSDYRGLDCMLYVYTVTNWPDTSLTVQADLYVYKGRVIGGDVHATELHGFMVGLK
jgi:hypothetical protein